MSKHERKARKLARNYPEYRPHQIRLLACEGILLDPVSAIRQRFKNKYGPAALEKVSPCAHWSDVLYEPES